MLSLFWAVAVVVVQLLSCVWLFWPHGLWTVACQAPLSMRFPRQEYWSGWPFPSPGDLPDPGIKPKSPSLRKDSLSTEPLEKPQTYLSLWKIWGFKKSREIAYTFLGVWMLETTACPFKGPAYRKSFGFILTPLLMTILIMAYALPAFLCCGCWPLTPTGCSPGYVWCVYVHGMMYMSFPLLLYAQQYTEVCLT